MLLLKHEVSTIGSKHESGFKLYLKGNVGYMSVLYLLVV